MASLVCAGDYDANAESAADVGSLAADLRALGDVDSPG